MNLKQRLGLRIQELRIKNKMTQAELAEKAEIATKHQSCIETGKNYPSSDLVEKYAKIFRIDVSQILNITHEIDTKIQLQEIYNMLEKAKSEDIAAIYKIIKSFFY